MGKSCTWMSETTFVRMTRSRFVTLTSWLHHLCFFFRLFVFRLVSRDENRTADPRRTLPLSWLRMILVVLFVETSEPPKAVGTCWFGSWEQTSIGDCHRVLLAVVAWLCSEWVPLWWNTCRRPFRHDLRRGQKVWSVAWRTTVALVQKSWDAFRFSTFFYLRQKFPAARLKLARSHFGCPRLAAHTQFIIPCGSIWTQTSHPKAAHRDGL